ncbi:hypothetical protein [Subtercola lobariae]|uniref:Uncharacterized protein n=1 Tax=Subtercola lobariae TaxID=1588641 RepID=A0A917B9Y1_9MICO|nr:hypothetical protein [Subtercola lobariae]GGF29954.1 hypothetical protein GCM10011399_23920 [Subtercola lobariae]
MSEPTGQPADASPSAAAGAAGGPAASRARVKRAPLPHQSLGVIVVGMSLAVWWPAFTLGAWGEIFFDTLLRVWVAATAAFFVVVVVRAARRRIGWRVLTLLLPTVWLVLSIAVDSDSGELWVALVSLAGILLVILGIPLMIWVLARVIWPDISDTVPFRGKVLALGIVLLIAVGSFVLGANQSRFLTCEDFSISGNSEPPGCVHDTPAPLSTP